MFDMGRKMLVNNKCPLCGEEVEMIADAILKQHPHEHNVELVVTKRGLKQYIHTNCWYDMIENNKTYNGKMYV